MPRVSNRQESLKWVRNHMYSSILLDSSSSEDLGLSASSDASSNSSGFLSPDSGTDLELDDSSDSEVGVAQDPSDVGSKTGDWLELHVVLDSERLEHSGNGVCLKRTLLVWGISTGSCVNYTVRAITALEDVIGHILKWPDRGERELISNEFAKRGFSGCVGLIDGTTMPLAQRPAAHGEVYFDRKSRYSINAQVVCDHKRKIIFMSSGMPGTCGDITCLKRSALWDRIHGDTIFDRRQYILGDSGYVNAPHMVCAFKMTMQRQDREDFNYCVAKARCVNEHCIGVLKNRWFSLKEIRTQLNLDKDHKWMCRWIRACGLLHNYVLDQNDDWTAEDMGACPLDVGEDFPADVHINQGRPAPTRRAGVRLRNRVAQMALAFNRQPGGALWESLDTL